MLPTTQVLPYALQCHLCCGAAASFLPAVSIMQIPTQTCTLARGLLSAATSFKAHVSSSCSCKDQCESSCSSQWLAVQAKCKAERAPALLERIQEAGDWHAMVDPTTAPERVRPAGASFLCDIGQRKTEPRDPIEALERFTQVDFGSWRRIRYSETVDALLVALCTLIATTAAGAVIVRCVTCHLHKDRSEDSLQREAAFKSACVPICCYKRAEASKKSGARRRLCAVVFALLVWAAMQVLFIFIVLPRQAEHRFPHALQHAVVDRIVNLGPRTGDECRTVQWDAGSAVQLETRLFIRRCLKQQHLNPGDSILTSQAACPSASRHLR